MDFIVFDKKEQKLSKSIQVKIVIKSEDMKVNEKNNHT